MMVEIPVLSRFCQLHSPYKKKLTAVFEPLNIISDNTTENMIDFQLLSRKGL